MKKIKSVAEIAMERVQKMKGTREDARSMEQEQYVKAAVSLGRSFLRRQTDTEEIKNTLQRYPEGYRAAAADAFINTVKSEMALENTPRILDVISALRDNEEMREFYFRVQELHGEYLRQQEEALKNLEERSWQAMKSRLVQAGIAGSAIAGFNLQRHSEFEEVISRIDQEYREILNRTGAS